jgi:hypothetical protein
MLREHNNNNWVELREFNNEACPGCMEQFEPNVDRVMMRACGHCAHPGCEARWGQLACMSCRQPSRPELQTFRPVIDDFEVEGSDSEASMGGGDLQPVVFNGVVGLNQLRGGGGKGESKGSDRLAVRAERIAAQRAAAYEVFVSDVEEDGNAEDIHLMTPPKTPSQGENEPFSQGTESSEVEMDDVVEPNLATMAVPCGPCVLGLPSSSGAAGAEDGGTEDAVEIPVPDSDLDEEQQSLPSGFSTKGHEGYTDEQKAAIKRTYAELEAGPA